MLEYNYGIVIGVAKTKSLRILIGHLQSSLYCPI